MTGQPGVYLTPEASLRFALTESVEREKVIAGIVAHLRNAGRFHRHRGRPRTWYAYRVWPGLR